MSTKKSAAATIAETAKPAAPKKSRRKPIEEFIAQVTGDDDGEEQEDGEGLGKIAMILKCYVQGYTKKEIVKAGYNKSTVYRQCKEYDNLHKAPITKFHGYDVYEGRIQRVMKNKNFTREQAAEWIAAKDLED